MIGEPQILYNWRRNQLPANPPWGEPPFCNPQEIAYRLGAMRLNDCRE
jgi:hypothetical protein